MELHRNFKKVTHLTLLKRLFEKKVVFFVFFALKRLYNIKKKCYNISKCKNDFSYVKKGVNLTWQEK